jgi:hypothetical protein
LAILTAVATLFIGCDDGRIKTYPAGGIIKFPDGRPLAGGSIWCQSPHGLAARAEIGEDGSFEFFTYEKTDGAVAGTHRAAIRPPESGDFDPDAGGTARRALIDARFMSMDTSGIVLEVSPDGPNRFEITVTAPR